MNAATQATSSHPSYDELVAQIAFLLRQNKELLEDKNYLEEQVRHLKRLRFAKSSEVAPSGQGTLFNEAEALAADTPAKPDKPKKPRKRGKSRRKPLPDDLPQIHKTIDLPDSEKVCAHSGQPLSVIGEEVSKTLDIEPMKITVIVTHRLKYGGCACTTCMGGIESPTMKTAPVEPHPIPKSMAAPGLLAYIAVSKYADALPLARQEGIFKRFGIDLVRATMARWMIALGVVITPLINLIRDELVKCKVIQADETRIQVHKGTGKAATAENYMWAFMANGPNDAKIVLYELGPSRSHTVPLRVLEDFTGYLHTDGYEAYETLAAKMPAITLVGDWAHVRRKFDEAIKAVAEDFKGEIKAKAGFELINALFRIEREDIGKDAPDDVRLKIRQEKSAKIIAELKTWADETAPTLPPKTLSGIAVRYMLERWEKLILFLDNPILRLDTNPVEGVIRPFVVGRNNWLFADTAKGAEASAALYSLIVMARANGINPFLYLKAVFTELPKAKTAEDVAALLPWIWKPAAK
ncbi:MAG: IS66 family transposase [Pseudolabrys sp.]|nr:IS66 family transposase [Pseudolabrys sp.]